MAFVPHHLLKSAASPPHTEGRKVEVLVVDDDPSILRIVSFFLSGQGFQVHTAVDGKEALLVLEANTHIDLVLSDVMMPNMSGLQLLKHLRQMERYADLPIILISAEGETFQKVTGLNLGADDFITKPFNFDELMARVNNHLRMRGLQRELMHANMLLKAQYELFIADLETAKRVQQAMMPDTFPEHVCFRLGAEYRPVERVGGDFFDVVFLENGKKLGILIVDVCGHGVAAAFVTAITKVSFRDACHRSSDPAVVLRQMNVALNANLKEGYVTAMYAVYDIAAQTLCYASGGHPPLLIYRHAGDEIFSLSPQATFLGMFESVDFSHELIQLQVGDRVVFYTDGLYESHDSAMEQYGIQRMKGALQTHGKLELQSMLEHLIKGVIDFVGERLPDDDITLVGLEVLA